MRKGRDIMSYDYEKLIGRMNEKYEKQYTKSNIHMLKLWDGRKELVP